MQVHLTSFSVIFWSSSVCYFFNIILEMYMSFDYIWGLHTSMTSENERVRKGLFIICMFFSGLIGAMILCYSNCKTHWNNWGHNNYMSNYMSGNIFPSLCKPIMTNRKVPNACRHIDQQTYVCHNKNTGARESVCGILC